MNLNVNFEIIDLDDKAVVKNGETIKASKFIAEMLLMHKGDSLKLYELAIKINKNDSIEVDTSDLKLIEDAIKAHPQYSNLIKGAILKEIECQKVTAKK